MSALKSFSRSIRSATLLMECLTVEWVFPLKHLPISSKDMPVISRMIYIAICRASLIFLSRLSETMFSTLTPVAAATFSRMRSRTTETGCVVFINSLMASFVISMVGAVFSSAQIACSFLTAPSSWRTLWLTCSAMNSKTLSGITKRSASALFLMIATRISKSGGWMSAMRPHSKRFLSRSVSFGISLGGLSDESTICLPSSVKELNVWKNSSSIEFLPAMNWMSSTKSASARRYFSRRATVLELRICSMMSFVKCSLVT